MPQTLDPDITAEKNRLNSSAVWLTLLQFNYGSESPVRVCLNSEQVTWNGDIYYPADFEAPTATETKEAQVNEIQLTFVDIARRLTPILEAYAGAVGAIVYLRVVHSDYLAHTTPEREDIFTVVSAAVDAKNVISLTLGQENLINRRCPTGRYLKNSCRFKFKDSRCGYVGAETACSLTLARCRALGNQHRFGGFPGVGGGGYFLS